LYLHIFDIYNPEKGKVVQKTVQSNPYHNKHNIGLPVHSS